MPRTADFLLLVTIGTTLAGCGSESTPEAKPAPAANAAASGQHDIDHASMDMSVSPGDDFYHYANGTWLKNTEIPADRASYGVFDILGEQSEQRTKGLLEEAASGKAAAGSDERRVGDYYASYLDEAIIEKRGVTPLEPVLTDIAAIADRRALSRWIGQSLRADVDPLNATNFYTDRVFGFWFAQDLNDPSRQVPYLLQGGLGLPDRDYYLETGKEMDRVRAAYRTHLVNVLTLAKMPDPAATSTRIYDFERKIAAVHWTRTQSSDVARANNHWTRADFDKKAPGIDWTALFDGAGLSAAQTFIVWQPDAIVGIARLVASQPMPAWREYLSFHAVDHNLAVLPKAFADEGFAFYGTALTRDRETARSMEARGRRYQRGDRPCGGEDVCGEVLSGGVEGTAQNHHREHQRRFRPSHRRVDLDVAKDQRKCQGESCQSDCRHWLSGYVARLRQPAGRSRRGL